MLGSSTIEFFEGTQWPFFFFEAHDILCVPLNDMIRAFYFLFDCPPANEILFLLVVREFIRSFDALFPVDTIPLFLKVLPRVVLHPPPLTFSNCVLALVYDPPSSLPFSFPHWIHASSLSYSDSVSSKGLTKLPLWPTPLLVPDILFPPLTPT